MTSMTYHFLSIKPADDWRRRRRRRRRREGGGGNLISLSIRSIWYSLGIGIFCFEKLLG